MTAASVLTLCLVLVTIGDLIAYARLRRRLRRLNKRQKVIRKDVNYVLDRLNSLEERLDGDDGIADQLQAIRTAFLGHIETDHGVDVEALLETAAVELCGAKLFDEEPGCDAAAAVAAMAGDHSLADANRRKKPRLGPAPGDEDFPF